MKQITITLSDDIYNRLEIRSAIDDQRIETGIEALLTHLVNQFENR